MTENEAIEELKFDCNELGKAIPCDTSWGESFENAYAMAINALKEIQQYRAIGTPEECRVAVEKQAEKKVLHNEKAKRYFCPTCERKCNYMHSLYCSGCGQKLDWSDEE